MSTPREAEVTPNTVWVADPYHTQVEFAAKHLGMMTVRGQFTDVKVTGTIDPVHPEATAIEATIQTASMRTNNEQRDNDLFERPCPALTQHTSANESSSVLPLNWKA